MIQTAAQIARFVRFAPGETQGREYHICSQDVRRWSFARVCGVVAGLLFYIVPGIILLLYFCFRRLKSTYGYAMVTGERLIYYEVNEHPTINFRFVRQVAIAEISGLRLSTEKALFRHEFAFAVWTRSAPALSVGARQVGLSWLRGGGGLEPGPDADEFIAQLSSLAAMTPRSSGGSSPGLRATR